VGSLSTADATSLADRLGQLQGQWLARLDEELPAALDLRNRLHAAPELSGQEHMTAAAVEQAMELELEVVAGTGRVGRIGPEDGPAVLLRGELDGLPVSEETGSAFASTNGCMHACGHDVHLAALAAVVRAARTLDLPVGLVPLLQPREETYPSGALDFVHSDAFDRLKVRAAVGAHVHPSIPLGAVATGEGVVNAAADEIEIQLHGQGGHGAYPHHAVDPVAAASHIVLALPELVRRTVSPMRPATISVGHLQAGEASANVLPGSARILATMRTTDEGDRRRVQEQVRRLVEHQAAAFGLGAEVTVTAGEPVLFNDPDLVTHIDRWLDAVTAEVTEPMRSLGADDFSYYADLVPSVMCFVGVRTEGVGTTPPLHHPRFLPTDEAVSHVARAMVCGYLGAAEGLLALGSQS